MSFLGIFFKTHHIDSDVKMLCKTLLEKCVLKLTNQEQIVYFLLSYCDTAISQIHHLYETKITSCCLVE